MADELDKRANMFEGVGADEYTVFRDAAMRLRALQDENDTLRERISQIEMPPF